MIRFDWPQRPVFAVIRFDCAQRRVSVDVSFRQSPTISLDYLFYFVKSLLENVNPALIYILSFHEIGSV